MTTPAELAGLVIGRKYILREADNGVPAGTEVEYNRDDGSPNPRFLVPKEYDSDGYTYLYVSKLDLTIRTDALAYKIDVTNGVTSITVNRSLPANKVKAILDIFGG